MRWKPPYPVVKLPDCQQNFDYLSRALIDANPAPSSALPVNPEDGQLAAYAVSGNVVWQFMYKQSSGLWHFVGGPPLYNEIVTTESTTSTAYVDLATVGPSVTVPLAGDYVISAGAVLSWTVSASVFAFASVKFGAAATSDADFGLALTGISGSSFGGNSQGSNLFRKTGLTASEVLKMQY
jgi:hypothetical protein